MECVGSRAPGVSFRVLAAGFRVWGFEAPKFNVTPLTFTTRSMLNLQLLKLRWNPEINVARFGDIFDYHYARMITGLWLVRNEGMDPYGSPYRTQYSSFHFLFRSFIPS